MSALKILFEAAAGRKSRCALFMSGAGSNAVNLLETAGRTDCPYEIAVLITDNPEKSAAAQLAQKYGVPLLAYDIRQFYRENGEDTIALTTPRRCELRDIWSDKLYEKMQPYQVDFGVLAGFVPLSNIVGKLPCLNIHPGDLTEVDENGRRIFAGLHYRPVENAMLKNDFLRSSVILAQNYQGSGKGEMDSGPVLGISVPVKIDLDGKSIAELQHISDARTAPPYKDDLRVLAEKNVENLKKSGDHVVLPPVVEHFVRGDYAVDGNGVLHFRQDGSWVAVETVEFASGSAGVPRLLNSVPAAKKRRNFFVRLIKYYYTKIVRTPGTPEFVARGWALGVAVGCIVPVFCQLFVAVPLSLFCRCSKVGAVGGTFVTTPPTAIFIYPVQIWVGNKIINGNISPDAATELVAIFNNSNYSFMEKWNAFADLGGELVAAFFAGGVAWAAFMVPFSYWGIKKLVVSYRKMREAKRKKLSA